MSEVKRYDCTNGKAQHCYGCYQMTESAEGDYVSSADFDAQRLRADTAEAELKRLGNLDTMQLIAELTKRNAAAEQRIAELRELLRLMTVEYAGCLEAGYDRITFLGGDCDSVSKMLDDNVNYAKACAALNPNAEAESHEKH